MRLISSFTNSFYTRVGDVKNCDRLSSQEANNQLEILKQNYNILSGETYATTFIVVSNVALLTFFYATSASWDVVLEPQGSSVPILIKVVGATSILATVGKVYSCFTRYLFFSNLPRNLIQLTKNERDFRSDFKEFLSHIHENIMTISHVKNANSTILLEDKKNV